MEVFNVVGDIKGICAGLKGICSDMPDFLTPLFQ